MIFWNLFSTHSITSTKTSIMPLHRNPRNRLTSVMLDGVRILKNHSQIIFRRTIMERDIQEDTELRATIQPSPTDLEDNQGLTRAPLEHMVHCQEITDLRSRLARRRCHEDFPKPNGYASAISYVDRTQTVRKDQQNSSINQ